MSRSGTSTIASFEDKAKSVVLEWHGARLNHTVVKAIAERLRLRPGLRFGDDCRSQIDAENRGGAVLRHEQAIVSANTAAEIETLATGNRPPAHVSELFPAAGD